MEPPFIKWIDNNLPFVLLLFNCSQIKLVSIETTFCLHSPGPIVAAERNGCFLTSRNKPHQKKKTPQDSIDMDPMLIMWKHTKSSFWRQD